MQKVHLRYVACVYPITGKLEEYYDTESKTLRELIDELDGLYGGFNEMFIEPETGHMQLNTMIYYGEEGKVPVAVLDIDQPVSDKAKITFW